MLLSHLLLPVLSAFGSGTPVDPISISPGPIPQEASEPQSAPDEERFDVIPSLVPS